MARLATATVKLSGQADATENSADQVYNSHGMDRQDLEFNFFCKRVVSSYTARILWCIVRRGSGAH